MRTKRNSRNPRTRRAKRALRRLHDPPSQRTLKSLKNLSYRDLKALSSEQLQKYKRRLHIIDQEGNPYTDEALRKKLRPYISAGSKKGGGKEKVIKGKGKITFHEEGDAEKMEKKYPDVEFEKMNQLTFTTTYKGNKEYDLKIQVGDTVIPCSFKKFAWPWLYGTILALEPHFDDLKKKADIRISGGIQKKLYQFFRHDYEKMQGKTKKGGGKTFKKEQKNANKKYYQSVKKCRKMKDKTEKDRKKKGKCYLPLDKQRFKTLQYLEKEYPDEWLEFKNKKGDSFHNATRLEGSGLYDWNPYKGERSSPRKGGGKSVYLEFKKGPSKKFWRIVKDGSKLTTHYGRIGSLGQTTTKDYGSKVDEEYEKLIQSKKKKGYVEKTDYGVSNHKKSTAIEREYMKVCRKAEKSKVLNPNQVNADCEGMLDQGEKELKWMTKWHKDALKKGEYNWDKYEDHYKSRKTRKK
tara:strand:- start:4476 stop:5864 length:1389 start_codon:yes stop_codon:yes gene_type:complete